jgi:hypothetical protein
MDLLGISQAHRGEAGDIDVLEFVPIMGVKLKIKPINTDPFRPSIDIRESQINLDLQSLLETPQPDVLQLDWHLSSIPMTDLLADIRAL